MDCKYKINKNIHSLIIVISFLFFSLPKIVVAQDLPKDFDYLTYRIISTVDLTAEVYKCKFGCTEAVVPDNVEINGKIYDVVSIGVHAFKNSAIVTCTIGKNVSKIDKEAFLDCKELREVEFGASFKKDDIKDDVFKGCTSLKFFSVNGNNPDYSSYDGIIYNKNFSVIEMIPPEIDEVTLYPELTDISEKAFYNCITLKSVKVPGSVVSIRDYAFYGCTSLGNIELPEGLSTLGDYAFSGCSWLKAINFPKGMTSVGEHTFDGCSALKEIYLPQKLMSIGSYAFRNSAISKIDLPEGLVSIGEHAFYGCSSLYSIIFPKDLRVIGGSAFGKCSSLEQISIPEKIDSIAAYTFSGCTSLKEVKFHEGITSIGDYAFSSCHSLSSVLFPGSLTILGEGTFRYCTGLEHISIPEKIDSIVAYTFSDCTSLKEVKFHEGITSIGDYAFSGCSYLENISLPEGLTNIGKNAFSRCSRLSVVELPESIRKIEERTFSYSGLESIRISSQLVSIGDFAFDNCKELKEISLPQSLTHLGKGVFSESGLMAVEIPGLLDTIPKQAFQNCISLTTVTIPQSVTDIETGAFKGCPNITDFKVAENNTCYFSDGPTLYNKEKTVLLCWPSAKGDVIIEEGVEEIKDDVFSDNLSIINLTIPASVKSIGSYFCYNATNLLYVYCYPTVPPELGYQSFCYDYINEYEFPIWEVIRCKIFVPKSSFTAYVNSNNWNRCYIFAMDLENGVEALPEDEISEPVSYTIFSTNGRQLLKDANIDALRSLPPGIYIVNGKKVVL